MNNTLRMVTLAAMAASVTVASIPAQAHGGVTKKQVINIVKKEVAKIPKVRGPRGHIGPMGSPGAPGPHGAAGQAGMDGMPFLFAHIHVDENAETSVDPSRSVGITQENFRVDTEVLEGAASPDPEGDSVLVTTYCFIGLPPVMGGQVTMDGDAGYAAVVSPKLRLNDPDGCPVRISIHGFEQFPDDHQEPPIPGSFYVLLY